MGIKGCRRASKSVLRAGRGPAARSLMGRSRWTSAAGAKEAGMIRVRAPRRRATAGPPLCFCDDGRRDRDPVVTSAPRRPTPDARRRRPRSRRELLLRPRDGGDDADEARYDDVKILDAPRRARHAARKTSQFGLCFCHRQRSTHQIKIARAPRRTARALDDASDTEVRRACLLPARAPSPQLFLETSQVCVVEHQQKSGSTERWPTRCAPTPAPRPGPRPRPPRA